MIKFNLGVMLFLTLILSDASAARVGIPGVLGIDRTIFYNIKSVWVSEGDLYLYYEKRDQVGVSTLLNIHGTSMNISAHFYYKKIPVRDIINEKQVDLSSGVISENLIYIDNDIELKSDESQVLLTTKKGKFSFTCDRRMWGRSNPVRFDNKIFYCGKFISIDENSVVNLPSFIENKISEISSGARVSANALENRELQISLFTRAHKEKTILRTLKFDIDTFEFKGYKSFPFDIGELNILNNYRGYFIEGQIVEQSFDFHSSNNLIYLCHSDNCSKFEGSFDYVIIDKVNNVSISIHSKLTSSPILKISTRRAQ